MTCEACGEDTAERCAGCRLAYCVGCMQDEEEEFCMACANERERREAKAPRSRRRSRGGES